MLRWMGSVNVLGFREWRVAKRSISERLRRDQVRIPGKCPMRFFLFLLVASATLFDWKLFCLWRPLCRCLWGPPLKEVDQALDLYKDAQRIVFHYLSYQFTLGWVKSLCPCEFKNIFFPLKKKDPHALATPAFALFLLKNLKEALLESRLGH